MIKGKSLVLAAAAVLAACGGSDSSTDGAQHVGAVMAFANGPFGFHTVHFPRGDFPYVLPVVGSCEAKVTPPGTGTTQYVEEAVTKVILWGPTGQGQPLPQMVDATYPYYLLASPPDWPAAQAAGKTFRWQILGTGTVPSFEVSFVAPEPVTSVMPLPKGGGLLDFARSNPPAISWNAATFGGQYLQLSVSGGDLAQSGSRRVLTCFPSDTGSFQLPAVELLKFAPTTVTIGVARFTRAPVPASVTGGGRADATSVYMGTDQYGNLIPMVFNVY